MREWISNSLEFLNLLPESEIVKGDTVKTFGIPWNYTEDLQIGGINFTYVDESPTKRGVLKVLAKVFDPLGLITPVTYGKVFLQDLWKEGISWDESLPDILCNKWMEILHKLKPLLALKIPRFVGNVNTSRQCELLVFYDASMKAYATAMYLRIEKQNTFCVNFFKDATSF